MMKEFGIDCGAAEHYDDPDLADLNNKLKQQGNTHCLKLLLV